ncbi:PASTA domain-containing protein [Natronoflexus pectinivorans]|uniref:Beta-lactam-binding protein with PASTA domain n=1 Tax=Natronoflexus pectinivorans TaxID=682526 RepID=A0A4R2GHP7_9BACT|nr:PASTA domain-containing protein [Natronoflexus pectinivorans]TCO07652.1 beta-lactam-binding protein with PASTA domain [Natronoflexus pectinivorans]
MSRWKILLEKTLWKHIGILAGSAVVLLISIFFFLKIYTLHGQGAPVPDFTGLTEQQLQHLINSRNLRYTIIDSVHIDNMPKGVVIEQVPGAGQKVKKNRRIFFTINAWTEEQVAVPSLMDYSLRNAKVILESFGLETGELIYIPSEYTNLVLGQHKEGKPVEPGTLVPRGSKIDLLIGRGLSSETTAVPDMIGMTLEEARRVARSVSLNIGATIYADTVATATDSLNAFVWRQNPPAQRGFQLNLGASIDIWLSIDEDLLKPDEPEDLPEQEITDDFGDEFF